MRLPHSLPILLFATCCISPSLAQDQKPSDSPPSADPFVKAPSSLAQPPQENSSVINLVIAMELIQAPHKQIHTYLTANPLQENANAFREEVQTWIAAGQASHLESTLIMTRSGQLGRVTSCLELPYPTLFDPLDSWPDFPAAIVSRNVGLTFEVDAVLGAAHKRIDVNVAPDFVTYTGEREHQPHQSGAIQEGDVRTPVFATQKTLTSFTSWLEDYQMVGIHNLEPGSSDTKTLLFVRSSMVPLELPATPKPNQDHAGSLPTIHGEWIEVPQETFHHWLYASPLAETATGFYEKASAAMKAGKARLVESTSILCRSGNRALNEAAQTLNYAKEWRYRGPTKESPNTVPHIHLDAFTSRKVGTILEVDPVLGTHGNVDLNLSPEIIAHVGEATHYRLLHEGDWIPVVNSPKFYNMSVQTAIRLPINTPILTTVFTPHDEAGQPDRTRKVLFFVKATR